MRQRAGRQAGRVQAWISLPPFSLHGLNQSNVSLMGYNVDQVLPLHVFSHHPGFDMLMFKVEIKGRQTGPFVRNRVADVWRSQLKLSRAESSTYRKSRPNCVTEL